MKISIIIPAYNVEKYIGDMLRDVINQTFTDFEAIIINDGSTDSTQNIVDEYCNKDNRFKSIIKENGGVSSARNAGLDIAKGDYVVFWDPDDAVPKKSLEYLYDCITKENADMAIGMRVLDNGMEVIRAASLSQLISQSEISKMDDRHVWVFSACNRLFKRSIIEKNNIRFKDISLGEDSVFWLEYMGYCDRITGCPKDVYIYKRRLFLDKADSLTQKKDRYYEGYFEQYIGYLEEMADKLFLNIDSSVETKYYKEKFFQELYKRLMRENLLYNMYCHIWTLTDKEENILRTQYEYVRSKIYDIEWQKFLHQEKQLDLTEGLKTKEEIISNPKVTFVLTRKLQNVSLILESIYKQEFPEFEILVDEAIYNDIQASISDKINIHVVSGKDLSEIKNNAVNIAKGKWIMYFEETIFPITDTIKSFLKKVDESETVVSLNMKRVENRKLVDLPLVDKAFQYKDKRIKKEVDNTFSNKMISLEFIRELKFNFTNDSRQDMISLYDVTSVTRRKSVIMHTLLTNDDFKAQIKHWKAKIKLYFMN